MSKEGTARPTQKQKGKAARTPRTYKPKDLSLEAWQIRLRREFGREQKFLLENLGQEPFFSEFGVTNPGTGGTYRVAIRGARPGDNFCSCPDFSVNTLGTCKHIEFTLARLMKRRGARAAFREGFQPPFSEVYLRYGARREVAFRAAAEAPERIRFLAARFFDERGILKPSAFGTIEVFLKEASTGGREVRFYEDAVQFVAQVRDDAARRRSIQRAFPGGARSPAFEGLLKTRLYPYQREGALFAALAGRSLIADDMGLGKTIEALAAVEILARHAGAGRVLVICPTSLKHQWHEEIERFTERLVLPVQGTLAARAACYETDSFYKISSYDVIYRDAEAIARWAPDVIILDEAQRIKNWRTRTAQSVKRLASPYAVVLTGTPLENRLEELHSIVEFVDRFRLGPAFRFLAEHQEVDDNGRVTGYTNLSRIGKTLAPILLRRGKDSVRLELPERMEKKFFVQMTPQQMEHHEENREMVARIAAKWRRTHFLSDSDQRRLRIALQNMRMACNSTFLLDHQTDFGTKADEAIALLEEILEQPAAKAVVFSQWVRTHELLIRRLEERELGFVFLHGGVPGPGRKELIRRFRSDPSCRVFLATDAGGVGLNLQCASVVLNMDLPWNPATLEQRIGRVHRMGQHRPVLAVHFVAEGTIEHGMLNLLAFKKSLFTGVLDGGEDAVFLGGTRLKRFMESVEEASRATPPAPPPQEPAAPEAPEAPPEDAPAFAKEPAREAATAAAGQPGAGAAWETVSPRPAPPPWNDVVAAGLSFLEQLGRALAPDASREQGPNRPLMVERDAATGHAYLKLPLPDPQVLERLSQVLGALAKRG